MKLFTRISTWVMIGLLVLLICANALIVKFTSTLTSDKDWKKQLTEQNEMYEKTISAPGQVNASKDQLKRLIEVNKYRIENDIPPTEDTSLWGLVSSAAGLVSVISFLSIIIGGGMVANEFSSGTIKLLLIRPSRRWKILLSKYIAVLFTTLIMLIVLFVFSFILGGLFFSFRGVSQPYLSYTNGSVAEVNMISHILSLYGYSCVTLIMMVTFAFMISTVFRNSSLAIGLAIFLMFTGDIAVTLLSKYEWVKYILFANTNLQVYSDGVPLVKGMTLRFSIAVLIVYFILFNAVSWFGFTKRDVAA